MNGSIICPLCAAVLHTLTSEDRALTHDALGKIVHELIAAHAPACKPEPAPETPPSAPTPEDAEAAQKAADLAKTPTLIPVPAARMWCPACHTKIKVAHSASDTGKLFAVCPGCKRAFAVTPLDPGEKVKGKHRNPAPVKLTQVEVERIDSAKVTEWITSRNWRGTLDQFVEAHEFAHDTVRVSELKAVARELFYKKGTRWFTDFPAPALAIVRDQDTPAPLDTYENVHATPEPRIPCPGYDKCENIPDPGDGLGCFTDCVSTREEPAPLPRIDLPSDLGKDAHATCSECSTALVNGSCPNCPGA